MTLEVHPQGNIRPEVPRKVRRLEGNQIRGKEATQEALPDGEAAEDLRRRKGYVEEESNRGIGECLANHLRDQHQVVVVHPN